MRIRAIVLLLVFVVAPGVWAQGKNIQAASDSKELNLRAYVELLRADVKSKKVQIFTELMGLDEQQAAAFWPIYREYDLELTALGDERLGIIQDYARNYINMTDEKADQLAERVIKLQEKRHELNKKYYERFKKALNPVLAMRFFQVEHQIQLILDLQLSASLPIVEETGSK